MLGVAAVGAVANLVSLLILRGGQRQSLNLRGAYPRSSVTCSGPWR